MRLRSTIAAIVGASAPAMSEPATVLRLEHPISLRDAIEVAERLGQLEFAVTRCGLAPNKDKVGILVQKQMESGAGGNMQATVEGLERKAKAFGVGSVCTGLLAMYGPNGSIIADAVAKK